METRGGRVAALWILSTVFLSPGCTASEGAVHVGARPFQALQFADHLQKDADLPGLSQQHASDRNPSRLREEAELLQRSARQLSSNKVKIVPGATRLPATKCASGKCSCATSCECSAKAPLCEHNIAAGTSKCQAKPSPDAPPIFFVHVPKTAGTSFRIAAGLAFGVDKMCFDYGPSARDTSAIVKQYVYGDHTAGQFMKVAPKACRMLSGHVEVTKYVKHFGLRRTVTFVRQPFERIISEYFHHVRLDSLAVPFLDWALAHKSMQWQCLGSHKIPLAAFGFLGLTEEYQTSLEMLNAEYATKIPMMQWNMAKDAKAPDNIKELYASIEAARVHPRAIAAVADEEAMYARATQIFAERKRMRSACKPYVHGELERVAAGVVQGWAWWAHSDEPVLVDIFAGGVRVGQATASDPHALAKWAAPRNGSVGFAFLLPASARAGVVRCEVAGTGQLLGQMTLPQPKPAKAVTVDKKADKTAVSR